MDVNGFINLGGDYILNPNYKKGNGQPKYIRSVNAPISNISSTLLSAGATYPTRFNPDEESNRLAEGMLEQKLALRREDYLNNNFAKILADSQPFLQQARNSFVQLISEGTLGTVKAFADLFDLITLQGILQDTDYQNPVSSTLEAWQKHIRENVVPIYQDDDVSILNGGLINPGFIFGGLPSVISSLTLLVPSKAVSWGLSKAAGWVTKKGINLMRSAEKAHRANQLGEAVEDVEKVSRSAKLNAFLTGNTGQRFRNIADYTVSGLTSRLLENYQESRQTYDDSKPVWNNILTNMAENDPDNYVKTVNDLRKQYGDDAADWNNIDSISDLVAREAADETFKDDLWNVFSDIYQMYAIGNVSRAINGPSRAALRRLNRQNINTVGLDNDAVKKVLESRSRLQKTKDAVSDFAFGAKHTILSELAEGIEEAVNYIAQEEGFNYGKILLNQEAKSNFWSDRFLDYLKAPKLWDSAFWGLAGGIIFNASAEYGNRFVNAINKIQEAKALAKTQVNNPEKPVHIPTFKEAFADTELGIRKANLEDNRNKFNELTKTLENINNGKDVYNITSDGTLKTDEEKEVARQRALLEFRDDVLLDAMMAGNYDLAKEYLSSNEIKQFFVDNNIMSTEEANRTQREILTRGDELKRAYDRQLRLIYNAVADWGENNDADLSTIPAEVFGVIARENIKTELENKHYQNQIDRLNRANAELERDSEKDIEAAAKANGLLGLNDLKSIIQQIGRAQQLGMVRAEIAHIKKNKQHLSASGQAILKQYEQTEKMLTDEIIKNSTVAGNDVATVANLLLSGQAAASVELLPFKQGEKHTYQANEGSDNFIKLADAVNKRDRKLLKQLLPSIESILDRNESTDETVDDFLNKVVNFINSKNEIIKNIHDNEGKVKLLQDINPQLEANYREIAALELNKLYNTTQKLNTTKERIQRRANDIINQINHGRVTALETSFMLYQQLAKKYGKDRIKNELKQYILYGEHTGVYYSLTAEERNAFDYMTKLSKFKRAEQDIILKDLYEALEYNDIYEYSKENDVVTSINDAIKKAKEKSSASEKTSDETQNRQSNNISQEEQQSNVGQGNGQINEIIPLSDDEQGEGVVIVDNPNASTGSVEEESPTGAAPISSTGESSEIDRSDIQNFIDNEIQQLEQSNPDGITRESLKEKAKAALKSVLSTADDNTLDELVTSTLDNLDELYEEEGESIESKLAKNVVKLSTIASNSNEEKIIKEANAILDKTFSNLLDHFNRHLSQGLIDGKYVINLEALLRYARHITNNEVDAQEMYNAFTKIIANNPNKYTTIKGRQLTETKLLENVNSTVDAAINNLEKSISGRTLNIKGLLEDIDNNTYKKEDGSKFTDDEKKELKKKIIEAVKSLRPGHKLYVRANYDNKKEKTKDPNGGYFTGGIDFVVIDNDGNETLIAKAPTPMYPKDGNKNMYNAQLEGWYYEIPLGREIGTKEYPIQIFFKQLFISDDDSALAFRNYLIQYETLTSEEAFSKLGDGLLDKAWTALEDFAKKNNINLNKFTQESKRNKDGNRERIRHLASLDIYTQNKWSLDVEELDYETTEEDVDLWKQSYRESIDQWFRKMSESNEARKIITGSIDIYGKQLIDVGVEVESVGKPVLVRTREEKALPATEAIADQHKDSAKLAAGDRTTRTHIVVSNGQPINMNGEDTTGRSIVVIDTPDGQKATINAYPIQANSKIFENNTALAAFKEALETKLFELMDEWFLRPNSENLQAFLDMLGHKSAETSKQGGSLFAGFFRSVLKNGNGFSIKYKVNAEGQIIPPTSMEEGEVHYLTFFDTVPLLNNKNGRTSKARAAVQDFVEGRENNQAVVWNTGNVSNIPLNDTSTLTALESMRAIIKKVLIDSLAVRIDPININADNNPAMEYGSFLSRDANGKLVLKVTGIKKPSENLKKSGYVKSNGDTNDIIIPNVGRDGKAGNFSDFIIFNDMVNLTTRPISGSNFTVFDNSDGDFGIQYRVGESSPVKKVTVEPISQPLSKIVNDIINNSRPNINISKAIVRSILSRIGNAYPSLYFLTKNSVILNRLLHKNVIFVDGFNGAKILYSDGSTEIISDKVYAAYIPGNVEIGTNKEVIKVEAGTIVVGNKFMSLLDGNISDILDALHHLLHENVHGFIADNDSANPELNARYKKELNDLWDEFSKKHPASDWARSNPNMTLEEFIVESLTNAQLMKELNDTLADEPLNNPKRPKTLLGKLFDKLINWLADVLRGPNGEKFEVNKDSLFAKEYAIFEEVISTIPDGEIKQTTKVKRVAKQKPATTVPKVIEGTLDFKEAIDDNTEEEIQDDGIVGFEYKTAKNKQPISSTGEVQIDNDTRSEPAKGKPTIKASTIGMVFPTLTGAMNNVSADTYFDIQEKIDNGVLPIKCN